MGKNGLVWFIPRAQLCQILLCFVMDLLLILILTYTTYGIIYIMSLQKPSNMKCMKSNNPYM